MKTQLTYNIKVRHWPANNRLILINPDMIISRLSTVLTGKCFLTVGQDVTSRVELWVEMVCLFHWGFDSFTTMVAL